MINDFYDHSALYQGNLNAIGYWLKREEPVKMYNSFLF